MTIADGLSGMSTVSESVRAQARMTPDRLALVAGDEHLTYAQLDARADRLADVLRASGVQGLVGVCLPRDAWIVPALLGVWKAGAACVPLDPAYPARRLELIAGDARLRTILTTTATRAAVPAGDARVILVDELPDPGAPTPGSPGGPGDLAYVLYTSGSTGRPKGAAIEHGNVLALLRWAIGTYTAEELSGSLAAASISFDFSILEIFAPLCAGGTVILAENLLALPTLPARDRVRMICAVPSALSVVLDLGLPASVRTVNTGGEVLTGGLRDRLYREPGIRRVINTYGPTECTTAVLAHEVRPDEVGRPPIGSPIAGARLSVRDAGGRLVPDGEPGELWIAGPGVSRGYLNQPELTAQRYVVDPGGGRAYRSGDLVRWADGVFHYVGRLDDQVKIRGNRVELGEVEAHLAAHPDIHAATVIAPDDDLGTRRLIAYAAVTPAAAPYGDPEERFRAYLTARLPRFMVPDRVVILDRLPLRPNGKVDRSALPPVPPREVSIVDSPEPTPVERRIAAVAAEVLGVPAIAARTPLPDYGWHSLAAAQICARVAAEFGVRLAVADLLARPTVAEFAELVTAASPPPAPLTRHPGRSSYPLTRMQRQFWGLRQVTGAPGVTSVAVRLRLTPVVDSEAVSRALTAIAGRHEALRSRLVDVDGLPSSLVVPAQPVPVRSHDRRGDEAAAAAYAAGLARAVAFDLTTDQPCRAELIRYDDRTELVFCVDHAVFDGWSTGVLMTELAAELSGAQEVVGPDLQVGDVALAEAGPAGTDRATAYWARTLAGVEPPGDLPGTVRSGPPRGTGGRITVGLEAALPAAVNAVAVRYGTTPYAVYAGALAVLLDCLLSRADILLGVAAARRDEPGLERTIGPLIDVLPVRLDLADDPPFAELMRRATRGIVGALAHRDLSPAEMAAAAGLVRPAGASLTPVVLSLQPESVPVRVGAGGVRVDLLGELDTGAAQNDLAVYVNATAAGTELQVEYADDRFTAAQANDLAQRLVRLLTQVVADPGRPVSTFDGLSPLQRQDILALGDGGDLPASRPATVVDAILAQAAARPSAPASVDDEGELSYGGLVQLAARVATGLVAAGVQPGDVVGACLPRDRWLPASLLGVWLAGAAYLPLDPELPPSRLRLLVMEAGARVVLAAAATARAVPDDAGVPTVVRDDLRADGGPPNPVGPAALAYVLYTSGSTGVPKGVEVSHGNLAAYVAAMLHEPGYDADDVFLAVSPVSFDLSCFDLWVPLCAGARVLVVSRDLAVDGAALAARIEAHGVTALDVTPTLLRVLIAGGWRGGPRVRLISGGEAMDASLAAALLDRAGALWNAYGPTETTVTVTMQRLAAPPAGPVPIGRPVLGARAYVLDRAGRLVPPGAAGELWIGGPGVARGYRGAPALTEASFGPDPHVPGGRRYRTGDLALWTPEGALAFLGRRDEQVKIHGYRIELGEIEAAVKAQPGVADAAVTVEQERLVAYLVPAAEGLDVSDVELQVRAVLPRYEVPRHWVTVSGLPRTASGKIDRRGLVAARRQLAPPPSRPPTTDLERYVAAVWGELLDVADVSADADFFTLGGDSLAATRVAVRLRDELRLDLGARLLFENPILVDYAAELERAALALLAVAADETEVAS